MIYGNSAANILNSFSGDDQLYGNAGDDTLIARGGNDLLNGGAGNDMLIGGSQADTMIGGTGNDRYSVDQADDVVVESAGEGEDWVEVDSSYVLAAGVSVEILSVRLITTMPVNLTGNEFGQIISGNPGNNVLDGGGGNDDLRGAGGADTLIGGTGNDVFRVDADDIIVEYAGEGDDMVRAASSYTLAEGVEVETMTTKAANKTTAIDLTGNSFDNLIYGNAGANVLSGGGGNDRLRGLEGDDTLVGGAGADQLSGGAGNDKFVFNAVSDSTVSSLDQILDFASGDLIDLSAIDANSGLAGDQAFTFVGSNDFTNTAGELRYEQVDGNTFIYGDTNGDGVADFAINVTGTHFFTSGDFVI